MGSKIFAARARVSKLSSVKLGGLSAGIGQAISDAFGDYSGLQRVGRVLLAGGIALGVGVTVAAVCAGSAGMGCAPAAVAAYGIVGTYVVRRAATEVDLGERLGLGPDF